VEQKGGGLPLSLSSAEKSTVLSQFLLPPQAAGAFRVSVSLAVPSMEPMILPLTGGVDNATCSQVTLQWKADLTVVWSVEGQAPSRVTVASLVDEPWPVKLIVYSGEALTGSASTPTDRAAPASRVSHQRARGLGRYSFGEG